LIIYSFSHTNLAQVLSNEYTSEAIVKKKNHFLYLKEYLGENGLNAKQIVVEEDYISRDFLHDYTSYYALCFENYNKFCKRVHLFSSEFTKREIKDALIGVNESKSNEIWNSYLGFLVVKPIPVTVVGFSILKTYSNGVDFGLRNFWGTREYKVHFYGKELTVQSLAFQEQDSVVSACATTAIWAMLNKAALDHYTILKSPTEITNDADELSSDGSRLFPNNGLNILQISKAIFKSGMVSEIKQADAQFKNKNGEAICNVVSKQYLKKIINAYSSIGIPIILIINVPNGNNYGLHAVTVSGYKKKAPVHIAPTKEVNYLSDNIQKIYAHDDQWGPFVRISFNEDHSLNIPWSEFHPQKSPTVATNIVVPLYPKIRIAFEDIEVITLGLDAILTFFFDKALQADLVWDIKLHFSEDFKQSVKSSNLETSLKEQLLMNSLPKYLWVVSCYVAEIKIFDFTFDATDVKNGMIGKDVVCYISDKYKKDLSSFLSINSKILSGLFRHPASEVYYNFLIDKLK